MYWVYVCVCSCAILSAPSHGGGAAASGITVMYVTYTCGSILYAVEVLFPWAYVIVVIMQWDVAMT